ncbi:hypothetical protein AB1Y20_020974 [Prymnesium parvum]|uniref:Uncharacterized protein n=1 Tax=Prymnesium parvum TaxID=97485 RepID=A0AB34JK51_PRYPA
MGCSHLLSFAAFAAFAALHGGAVAAFSSCSSTRAQRHKHARPPVASISTQLPTIEAAKLFGRMADSVLYLDAAVGACCHSACSDCEWRDPEGGYRFDMLRAIKGKWICCYAHRDFHDARGSHTPRWVNILFPGREAGAALSRSDFTSRLCAAPFEMPMGPRGNIVAGEDVLAPETLDSFWAYLAEGSETITLQTMVQRLQDMSPDENRDGAIGEGPDALDWKAFAKGLGVSPFEKW